MQGSMKILFLIFLLGLLSKNNLVACAAGLMLSLSASNLIQLSPTHQKFFLDVGIVFLIIAVLLPFSTQDVSLSVFYKSIFSFEGIIATGVGILSAVLAGKGVHLLKIQPEVLIGLVFGNIIGTSFFKGIPTGPLVAAGIAAFFIYLLKAF